jgi:hypothetical protein
MPGYANHEAECVGYGISLGGSGTQVHNAIHAATAPLSVDDLERIFRPDSHATYAERTREETSNGWDRIGMLKMSRTPDGRYSIAAQWHGWFPGSYASRDVALTAYGFILGGEAAGYLEELRDQVVCGEQRAITIEDLNAFAQR